MKYVKEIAFYKEEKILRIEITSDRYIKFDDVYMIVKEYRKFVDVIQVWDENCKIQFNAKEMSAYDLQNLLEKMI